MSFTHRKIFIFILITLALHTTACGGGGGSSDNGGANSSTPGLPVVRDSQGDVVVGEPTFTQKSVIDSWLIEVNANQTNFNFYLYTPENYNTDDSTYPLVIFLHGDDGNNLTHTTLSQKNLAQGPLAPLISNGVLNPDARTLLNSNIKNAFVIYPEVLKIDRSGAYRDPLGYWNPNALNKIIEYLANTYRIDSRRIYVTGLSMGGGGTFHYARTNAEKVAAIVPICNGLYGAWGLEKLKSVPVWLFHNYDDATVNLETSILPTLQLITSGTDFLATYPYKDGNPINDYTVSYNQGTELEPWILGSDFVNGHVNFTLYASGGHNAWDKTYTNDAMWDWLFSQTNQRESEQDTPPITDFQ